MKKSKYLPPCAMFFFAITVLLPAGCNRKGCLDFDNLALNSVHKSGATFVSAEIPIDVKAFISEGGPIPGDVKIDTGNVPGFGNNLNVRNANLFFNFEYPLRELKLSFADYGGSINLTINGVLKSGRNFMAFNGLRIKGVGVITKADGPAGTIWLRGRIKEFLIGGRNLWLDDIVYVR